MEYKVAYQYMVSGEMSVVASSLEEAKEKARVLSCKNSNESPIEGTFEINESYTNEINE